MKNLTNDFIQYLLSIGIVSNDSIDDFYQINSNYQTEEEKQSREETEECFKESMAMSLIHFIYNLDSKRKRLLMLNVILHFIENSKHKQAQKLKGIILMMSHSNSIQRQAPIHIPFKMRFSQWRASTPLSSIASFPKIVPVCRTVQPTPMSTEPNKTNPQSHHSEYYEKLYLDHKLHSKKRDNRTIELNTLEGNINTFTPAINHSNTLKTSKSLFHLRQSAFLQFKEKHTKERSLHLDTQEGNECRFIPSITSYSFKHPRTAGSSPIHLRLYTDFNIRRQKLIRKQREAEDTIKNSSNHNKSQSIDIRRIHFLYNEYKLKKNAQSDLAKTVDNDIGNTFQPHVSHDRYYHNVNKSFFQRESELLQNRLLIREIDEQNFKLNRKRNQVGYQSFVCKKKSEVSSQVVARLFPKCESKAKQRKIFITASTFEQSRNGVSNNSTNHNQIEVINKESSL